MERYQVRLYDTTGKQVKVFTDWNSLYYQKAIGETYSHQISFYDDYSSDPAVGLKSLFQTDYIVEVWRKTDRIAWYCDYTGFHRTGLRHVTTKNDYIFTSYGRGLNDLLRRRSLLYPAVTTYSLKDGPGETVIKEFVYENAGPGSNSVYRKRSGVIPSFAIQADSGLGVTWKGQRAWKNLLEICKEIGAATNVDYEVVRSQTEPIQFEFRTYYPQLGTDRRLTCRISPAFGNMLEPYYSLSRTEEGNIVAVLGQGEGNSRKVVIVQDAAAATVSPWNDCEVTKDARNDATYLGMLNDGNEYLLEVQAKEEFTFEVPDVPGFEYGLEYNFGDIVMSMFEEVEEPKKLTEVAITVAEGKNKKEIKFSDLPR